MHQGSKLLLIGLLFVNVCNASQNGLIKQDQSSFTRRRRDSLRNVRIALKWGYIFNGDNLSFRLVQGHDINTFIMSDVTDFMFNCYNNPDAAKQQIETGIENINAQTCLGITALMIASRYNPELMNCLVSAGADLIIVDKSNKTALDYFFEPLFKSNSTN